MSDLLKIANKFKKIIAQEKQEPDFYYIIKKNMSTRIENLFGISREYFTVEVKDLNQIRHITIIFSTPWAKFLNLALMRQELNKKNQQGYVYRLGYKQ